MSPGAQQVEPVPARAALPPYVAGLCKLLLTVAAAVVVLALALPLRTIVEHRDGESACGINLRSLWQLQSTWMANSKHKTYPNGIGRNFWLALTQGPQPLISTRDRDLLGCPVSPDELDCEYRGPRADVNVYDDNDPVGADLEGAHGPGCGGNVLLMNGSVHLVEKGDPLWLAAESRLTP